MLLSHWLNGIRCRLRFPSLSRKSFRRGSRLRRRFASSSSPIPAYVEVCEARSLLAAQPVTFSFDQTPLAFDTNQAQADANVAYVSRGADINLTLLRHGAVLDFGQSIAAPTSPAGVAGQPPAASHAQVSLTWQGGNAAPGLVGLGALPGIANSLSGSGSTGARSGTSSVERVQYGDVYRGIDLAFYGHGKSIEFDWDVAPHADPAQITMVYAGMDKLSLDAGGDLVISAGGQQLVQQAPVVYQVIAGEKREVASSYRLDDRGAVGFALGAYDHNSQLIIDPVIGFSTYFGGSRNDFANGVATDSKGNTYVVGSTKSADLAGGSGPIVSEYRDFIAKFGADGQLAYMRVLGRPSEFDSSGYARSFGRQVAVGPDDLPIVLYESDQGATFPLGDGRILEAPGTRSMHLAKLSEAGSDLFDVIAPTPNGPAIDSGWTSASEYMAVDNTGAIYATYDAARDVGKFNLVEQPFLTKLAADGTVQFTRHLFEVPSAIAVDSQHNIYLGMTTSRTDLLGTPGAYQACKAGGNNTTDVFLAELDPTGSGVLAATYLGGPGNDRVGAIAADQNSPGRIYIVGKTDGDFPLQNPLQTRPVKLPPFTEESNANAVISLLDMTKMELVASTYFGGNRGDYLEGIVLDRAGNVYVAGSTSSRDLPLIHPIQAVRTLGPRFLASGRVYIARDFVVAKLDATLSRTLFSTYYGGSGHDAWATLAVDRFGTIHVAGTTSGKVLNVDGIIESTDDFPVVKAQQANFAGGEFVAFDAFKNLQTDAVVFTIGQDLTVTARRVTAAVGETYTKPVATFTAPDPTSPATNFTAEINWGDGSVQSGTVEETSDPTAPYQVVGSHTYMKPGAYPVVVTVTDIKEKNRATTAYDVSQQAATQVETTIAVDPHDRQRVFTASNDLHRDVTRILFAAYSTDGGVTWTPSTTASGTLTPVAAVFEVGANFNDGWEIAGTHPFSEEATVPVDVSITDLGGSTGTAQSSATIVDFTPQGVAVTPALTVLQGISTGTLSLAQFTVPGGLETGTNEYSATIDWGNGSPVQGGLSLAGSVITVTGGHTYTTAGTVPVTVTLTDDTGNSVTVPLKAVVEPDVTLKVHISGSGLTFNPVTNRFVGDLSITNVTSADISDPLYVVIHNLPNGVTLNSFTDVDGAGNPLFKVDQSRLSAFASLAPIPLEFSNPAHVPITYTVQVFDGLRAPLVGAAELVFEPNRGQASDAVSFIARGHGYIIGLAAGQASLVLKGSADQAGATARMQIVGANASPVGEAVDAQPGVSNYFSGGAAITGVPHFGRVRYSGIYTGIDVEYYGKDGLLENDWIVHPGVNADAISLRFDGVDGMSKDAAGNLVLRIPGGELVQRAPVAYQIVGGSRREVAAAYDVRADGSVGFVLGAYDHSLALVIDPVLVYSSYLGGGSSGSGPLRETDGFSVAVDKAGHAWVAGFTQSLLFPITFTAPLLPGSIDPLIAGGAFLTELAVDGSSLVRSSVFGGRYEFFDIAVDDPGNVYAAGDGFALKFDATTNTVPYVTYFGGTSRGIAVDGSGQVYIAGNTGGGLVTKNALFPVYRTNNPVTDNNFGDGFVTKLYADGRIAFSTPTWARTMSS